MPGLRHPRRHLPLVADEPQPAVRVWTEGIHRVGDPGRHRQEDLIHGGERSARSTVRELGGTWRVPVSRPRGRSSSTFDPEYDRQQITGAILARKKVGDDAALRGGLAERGAGMSRPLGFNDTYAIGMARNGGRAAGRGQPLRPAPGIP